LKNRLFIGLLLCAATLAGLPVTGSAQENDAGLWTNATIEKKINKDLDLVFTEEFRFNENVTQLESFFSDFGAEYSIIKGLKTGLFYRFINKRNLDGSYSQAHRFYGDVSYKRKLKRFEAGYRVRLQIQYRDVNRSETGNVPDWYIRQKLHFGYNTRSRFDPYLDGEIWYKVGPEWYGFDNIRISAGSTVRITKNHSLDLAYIYQQEFNVANPVTDFIFFVGYKFSF
jgi:hypothetical protein